MASELKTHTSDQPQQGVLAQPHSVLLLAGLAIAGQVCLFASAWLLPAVSEYRLIGDDISELVLGRYGFVQTVAFLIAGLGTLGLAFAIRQLTRGARGSFVGSLLIGIYGAGAILAAIFPTDRIDSPADMWSQSTTGTTHSVVALISFLCAIIGMFVLTWMFAREGRWRSLTRWSAICATGALALMFVQGEGPLVGLLQRLFVGVISAWLILVALRVRAIARSAEGWNQAHD